MSPSTSTHPLGQPSSFESLGVRRVINCKGTYTDISGSRLVPQAAEAMAAASDAYISMDELLQRVGERLVELTGAEWGLITCGCAAAIAQTAAACMAGADPERMAQLPDTTAMPNEILIQKAHRNQYDRALELVGGRLIQVETAAEYLQAFGPHTALVAIIGDYEEDSAFPIPWMIEQAHQHGVPCLVDAAAQRPDVPNRYLAMGADAVAYSGGKCLRGPQASGLLLGRKDLLQAASLNGAPHHGVGRPMKMGKEEIMGLLGAVEAWLLYRDHQAEWRAWESYLEEIRQAIEALPTVTTRIDQPGLANHAPTLAITWDAQRLGTTPQAVHATLWEGNPRIALHLEGDSLRIMPYMMEEGDAAFVAQRLRQALTQPGLSTWGSEPPSCDLTGQWCFELAFTLGQARHAVQLKQERGRLSGVYVTPYNRVPLAGEVSGQHVRFQVTLGRSANMTCYRFEGAVLDDGLAGEVDLGEYWRGAWRAERCAPTTDETTNDKGVVP